MSASAPKRKRRKPIDRSAVRHIYTIRGPSGVYVGCTRKVAARWSLHRTYARRDEYGPCRQPIHDAMRSDGIERYSFDVVACARGWYDGEYAEHQLIVQLIADGENVLNVRRRDASRAPIFNSITQPSVGA